MKKKRVLFICADNSARSQMAERYLRHYASDRFEVFSAGLEPRPIHPLAIEVMDEIGVNIRNQSSKDVKKYLGKETFHHVIFVSQKKTLIATFIGVIAVGILLVGYLFNWLI